MKISTMSPLPAYVPRPLTKELLAEPGSSKDYLPGFVLDARVLPAQNPALSAAIAGLKAQGGGLTGAPCLVVSPRETPAIFQHKDELDLLKTVVGEIVKQAHPRLKTGIDAVWLVYRAFQLHEEWKAPDANRTACLLKLAGLGLGAASLTGRAFPDMKIPDPWSNGLNFVLKAGGSLVEGKTVPVNELLLSMDKRQEIPLKIFKLAGLSLDPPPSTSGTLGLPLPRPAVSPLATSRE